MTQKERKIKGRNTKQERDIKTKEMKKTKKKGRKKEVLFIKICLS